MVNLTQLFGTPHPVALVTGSGAPRIGNCVARALAQRGYRLAIHAHTSLADAQTTGDELGAGSGDAIVLSADLRNEVETRQLVDRVQHHFGRLDVLVNCAAIWEAKAFEEIAAGDVRAHWEVNTLATFVCCQQAGLLMVKQATGGAIVNIGDWAVVRPYRDHAAYFPSKGAIPTLTRNFAVELAARNPQVRVNAVLPGPVTLPHDLSEDQRQAAINSTLVKRAGSPQNVAHAVVFLLENDFVTGVNLPVDGGRTIYSPEIEPTSGLNL